MLCRESFDHHSRLSRNTVLSLQSKPLYQVTITTTIDKWQGHLLQKIMGERNILLSVKHLVMVLKRTVSMRRFPSSYVLVDKKDFFITYTFTHVGHLDACEKTVNILSDNHIMTKPKKWLCLTMKQIIFGLLFQSILLITFKHTQLHQRYRY